MEQEIINDQLIDELSVELGMSKAKIKEIVNVQSHFTARVIRMGGYEGVMWPLLGKIKVKVERVYNQHRKMGNSDIRKNTSSPKND